jgi:RNA polymerase-binding transcription factor DksA
MPSRTGRRSALPTLLDDHLWLAEQRARCESELVDEICDLLVKIGEEEARNTSEGLVQLAAGTYGYCLDCHNRIPAHRLDALSFAVRCATCDRARESSARIWGDVPSPLAACH